MTSRFEEAINLAVEILDDIEEGGDVEKNLRKYNKLTKYIDNKEENRWANNELLGYQNDYEVPEYRRFKVKKSSLPIIDDPRIHIKASCDTLKRIVKYGESRTYGHIPNSLVTSSVRLPNSNLYQFLGNTKNNETTIGSDAHLELLNTIRNRIYIKTTDVLFELKFEKIESDIFNETRIFVNQELNPICPKALQKLTETYESLIHSDSPLEIQQIAFACRTVLEDFADSVYPPKEEKVIGFDDKAHPVKDNHHINRITQYVYENTESDSTKDFMKSNLEYLYNFIRNIYEQTNIGTHDEREKEHANRCVIYTYLVLGDVIRLSK